MSPLPTTTLPIEDPMIAFKRMKRVATGLFVLMTLIFIAAKYFESMLIDYDVHSNYGNWMYNAGVGNDPRDRKFNIKRQAEMYDAAGKYQKLWLRWCCLRQ